MEGTVENNSQRGGGETSAPSWDAMVAPRYPLLTGRRGALAEAGSPRKCDSPWFESSSATGRLCAPDQVPRASVYLFVTCSSQCLSLVVAMGITEKMSIQLACGDES